MSLPGLLPKLKTKLADWEHFSFVNISAIESGKLRLLTVVIERTLAKVRCTRLITESVF